MTCSETFGNGARMFGTVTMREPLQMAAHGLMAPRASPAVVCVAVPGTMTLSVVARLTEVASGGTSQPTISAFVLSSAAPENVLPRSFSPELRCTFHECRLRAKTKNSIV